ncbi:MAG: lamin tail domain-containing protein, partial [Melioribacteraceae bacterium]|nr:lamin tail domain-containing protein [Melioribacteraceae bacterium]
MSRYLFVYILLFMVLLINNSIGQRILINEIMSSNSSFYYDEYGDTPDWIEIYNGSDETIDLSTYYLSDDKNIPNKWAFPVIQLEPDSILLVNASGRDIRTNTLSWETVIDIGDSWFYRLGNEEPNINWRELGFIPEGWNIGSSGIGYGDDDDFTVISPQNSIYLRKEFEIPDLEIITEALFNIDYDDGFVAYLNGQEIARANLGNPGEFVPYDKKSDESHEALLYRNLPLETYFIDHISTILVSGINVLAIQVHNFGNNSSDLSAIPFLTLGFSSSGNKYIAEEVKGFLPKIHTSFSISNGNESVFLFDNSGNIVDSVSSILLPNNTSYGRLLNDINTWSIFQSPTPGYPNSEEGYAGQVDTPNISLPSGFFQTNVNLSLINQEEGAKYYYTLDGSEPDISSALFINQLTLNETTVLRIKSFKDGFLPSKTITNTYFIDLKSDLPVISLATDPDNLWDFNEGIYVFGPNAESAFP